MIRHCIPEDEYVGDGKDRCGLTFDDVERSTICPHDLLPTRDEKTEFYKKMREESKKRDDHS